MCQSISQSDGMEEMYGLSQYTTGNGDVPGNSTPGQRNEKGPRSFHKGTCPQHLYGKICEECCSGECQNVLRTSPLELMLSNLPKNICKSTKFTLQILIRTWFFLFSSPGSSFACGELTIAATCVVAVMLCVGCPFEWCVFNRFAGLGNARCSMLIPSDVRTAEASMSASSSESVSTYAMAWRNLCVVGVFMESTGTQSYVGFNLNEVLVSDDTVDWIWADIPHVFLFGYHLRPKERTGVVRPDLLRKRFC